MTDLTREQVEKYLKGQGHPYPENDGTLDEFMNGGERQGMYDEAVRNNYALLDVDRWFHLVKVMGVDMKFETALKIDRALYEEDLETMELNLPEERFGLDAYGRGVFKGSYEEVKEQVRSEVIQKEGFSVGKLADIQVPGMRLADAFQLYAELRGQTDGLRTLLLGNRDEVWDISGPENERLLPYELDKIVEPYLMKESPLDQFIEQEVPFRLREVLGVELSQGQIANVVEAVKDHNDVMFDYDRFDEFLGEQVEEICGPALEGRDRGEPKQHKFIFDDELMINDDFESINGYLWAVDYLVDKLTVSENMENINFYADYDVRNGGLTLTASYDTFADGKEVNRVVDIPITMEERVGIIAEMEKYCQKRYGRDLNGFVQEVKDGERFGDGLEPGFAGEKGSSLEAQIKAAEGLRVPGGVDSGKAKEQEFEYV